MSRAPRPLTPARPLPRRPSPGGRRGPARRLRGGPGRRQQPAEVGVVVLLGAEQRQQRGAVVVQRLPEQLPIHPGANAAASPGTGTAARATATGRDRAAAAPPAGGRTALTGGGPARPVRGPVSSL